MSRQGWLVDAIDGTAAPRPRSRRRAERLPGAHNWQNAAAAYAAARACGIASAVATAAICSFPGLAHRQELVGTIDGIRYINDSKATNADATEKALLCYHGDLLDRRRAAEGGRDHAARAVFQPRSGMPS